MDLINRDNLHEHFRNKMKNIIGYGKWSQAEECESWIDDLPTVDAVPVTHGHWRWCKNGEIRCSKCFDLSGVVSTKDNFKECVETLNYCSNCGARMDEVE